MSNPPSMHDHIKAQAEAHQDQFDIATESAINRGFQRWFDDTWTSAKAKGALPNPFISSMFVFFVTVLVKKFLKGLPEGMPVEYKEMAIADAKQMMIGYLDQIEASAIKDIHSPHPPESSSEIGASTITPKGKQTLILPEKKRFRQ